MRKVEPGPKFGIAFATHGGAHLGPREAEANLTLLEKDLVAQTDGFEVSQVRELVIGLALLRPPCSQYQEREQSPNVKMFPSQSIRISPV